MSKFKSILAMFSSTLLFLLLNMFLTTYALPEPVIIVVTGTPNSVIPIQTHRTPDESLTDRRILYLGNAESIPEDSYLLPSRLLGTAAEVEFTASRIEAQSFGLEGRIDAIVVHRSALAVIDPVWVRELIDQGSVFMSLNIRFAELAELFDSDCTRINAAHLDAQYEGKGDFFFASSMMVVAEYEEDRLAMIAHLRQNCGEYLGGIELKGEVYIETMSFPELMSSDVSRFRQVLASQIYSYESLVRQLNIARIGVPTQPPSFITGG